IAARELRGFSALDRDCRQADCCNSQRYPELPRKFHCHCPPLGPMNGQLNPAASKRHFVVIEWDVSAKTGPLHQHRGGVVMPHAAPDTSAGPRAYSATLAPVR